MAALTAALLSLTGCTTARPEPGTPVVVTLGDSVPAGTACDCTPFPDLYARLLSPHATSINLARPGFVTTDVRTQISEAGSRVAIGSANVVVVMAGGNDMAQAFDGGDDYPATAELVHDAMSSIIDTVRHDHDGPVDILVLGYWNVVEDGTVGLSTYGADGLKEADEATAYCNSALRLAAEQHGATYLDTSAVFEGDPTGMLAPDGDHPNAAGHMAIADLLYDRR